MTPGQAVFVPGEWRSLASCWVSRRRECGIVRAVFDGESEKGAAERLGLSPQHRATPTCGASIASCTCRVARNYWSACSPNSRVAETRDERRRRKRPELRQHPL